MPVMAMSLLGDGALEREMLNRRSMAKPTQSVSVSFRYSWRGTKTLRAYGLRARTSSPKARRTSG